MRTSLGEWRSTLEGEGSLASSLGRSDHELERDVLAGYLDGLDEELGPVTAELVDAYDELWP